MSPANFSAVDEAARGAGEADDRPARPPRRDLSLKGGSCRLKDRDLKPSPGESPLNGRRLELGVSFCCTTVQDAEQVLLGLGSHRMRVTSCCEHDFGRAVDESDDVVVPQFVREPFGRRDDALPGCMYTIGQRDAQFRDRCARAACAAQSARAAECGEVATGKSFAW
jgi:hypothetical protein